MSCPVGSLKISQKPLFIVPFRRDPDFVDRGDLLSQINKRCSQPAGRAALVGLGGVGKSQLAIEYAYRTRDRLPLIWVFWVYAGTRARFEEGYRRIAEVTRMDGWNNKKVDILRLVHIWLSDESNGLWIMIVDNADDSGVFSSPLDSGRLDQATVVLSDFLPQSPNGSILFTSRSREAAFRLTGSYRDIVKVDRMDREHALALVRKKILGGYEQDDAVALIEALDYMPLAITQAAAYINQRAPRATVAKYVHKLGQGGRDRAKLLDLDIGDMRRDGKASNSIMVTWQISFEYIRRARPSAIRLLSLMSLFDRQGIPESLLSGRYGEVDDDQSDFEDDLNMLLNFSLASTDLSGSQVEMHRLVQLSTKRWLELNKELEAWKEKYLTLMDESYPVGRYENWTVCQALFPHAQAVVDARPINDRLEAWASTLFKAAWYASEMGNYQAAWEMGISALEARKVTLGEEHPDTLNSLNSIGLVLVWQGKFKEAEAMHQRALQANKRVLGDDHPSTLTSIANLASTYRNQGRWKEAEELFVQVIEISKRVLGADHPDTLTSMANLASTYRNQGRWKEAEELEVQVMEMSKRVLGDDHPHTLISMANLASTYRNQGRWKEAEELEVQVMEASKRVLSDDHPHTLTSMANLASTYRNQGRWKEAEELEVQ
ncbi:TPR-like protein, partial [Lojkania enalia]